MATLIEQVCWCHYLKKNFKFIYVWLCWVFVYVCGLSLVAAGGGYSLVVVYGLLIALAAHSSVLAWRIPGAGEPGGLPSMGSHRVGHD